MIISIINISEQIIDNIYISYHTALITEWYSACLVLNCFAFVFM